MPSSVGPLDGIRVVDFSRVLAGPHCGRALADMGADVIKVEPPDGDLSRFLGPRLHSQSMFYTQQNCGKRNVSLDLSRPEAVGLLGRLVAEADVDVVLENFRPGVMARMGLGYDVLSAGNERLIYAAISGYGIGNVWSDRRAYARAVHAEAGIMLMSAEGVRSAAPAPVHSVYSHADVYTGIECLAAINAALFARERTGRGQRIDVAMAETMLAVNEHAAVEWSGLDQGPLAALGKGQQPVFQLPDGRWLTVIADLLAPGIFEATCQVIDRPDLAADERLATVEGRIVHESDVLGAVQDWVTAQGDAETVEKAMGSVRLAVGVLRTIHEVADSDWAAERGAVVEIDDRAGGTVRVPNSPWRFSDAAVSVAGPAPYRGEHNRDVFGGLLGLADDELDRLSTDGVLSSRPPSVR